jgi:lipopolysaccharide export system permease protein
LARVRLLDRYLFRELLFPLGYCLAGFLVLLVSFDLFSELDELQRNHLQPADVVEYYLVRLPVMLVEFYLIPVALLMALLYTLTNLARHNELTAMRAAGLSLWRLCAPHLSVGLLLAAGFFALNELLVPGSAAMAGEILERRLPRTETALGRDWHPKLNFHNSRDGRFWFIQAYNTVTHEMIKPSVVWVLPQGARRELSAERAVRRDGAWVFRDAQEIHYSPIPKAAAGPDGTPAAPGVTAADLRLGQIIRVHQTNEMVLPEFTETPEQIRSEIKMAGLSSRDASKRPQLSITEILHYLRLHPELTPREHALLHTQLHARLAAPFTCLVVVLIAIPFGAPAGRRNVYLGVASSILSCFAYFVLMRLGLALGIGGHAPPWLVAWFPNLLFGVAGIWLTARLR